uniref:Cytoplasm protein n=1 Tax=Phakopsora pachyrhizi TaxID=170000 RepID=A0A0S1MIT0_PHAPC
MIRLCPWVTMCVWFVQRFFVLFRVPLLDLCCRHSIYHTRINLIHLGSHHNLVACSSHRCTGLNTPPSSTCPN